MTPLARSLLLSAALFLGLLLGVVDGFLPTGFTAMDRPSRKANPSPSPPTPTALAASMTDPQPRQQARPEWLPKIPEGCDSDYECEGTESCCDFIFFKMCCSDGGHAQEAWTPVPIPVRPGDGYQGGYAGNGGWGGNSGGRGLYN